MARQTTWDFFLAHAGRDEPVARTLHDHLIGQSRVFLDSVCLRLGDDWDVSLARAQRESLVSVILVSSRTEAAYYQREEVAAAIALARQQPDNHRVVPVYIDGSTGASEVPYGLRLKHGITINENCSLSQAAERLLTLLRSHVESTAEERAARSTAAVDAPSAPTEKRPFRQTFDLEKFEQLKSYACSISGLNLSSNDAREWAEQRLLMNGVK